MTKTSESAPRPNPIAARIVVLVACAAVVAAASATRSWRIPDELPEPSGVLENAPPQGEDVDLGRAGALLGVAAEILAGGAKAHGVESGLGHRIAVVSLRTPDGPMSVAFGRGRNLDEAVRLAAHEVASHRGPSERGQPVLRLDILRELGPPRPLGDPRAVEIDQGVDGVYFPVSNIWLLPDELTARGLVDEKTGALRPAFLEAYLSGTQSEQVTKDFAAERDYQVATFATFVQRPDGPIELYRGNPPDTPLDRARLMEASREAGEYLLRKQKPDGSFVYRYQAGWNQMSDGYNALRHAGACYALYELCDATGDLRFARGADRGVAWLLAERARRWPADARDDRMLAILEGDDAKLGGAALAALALLRSLPHGGIEGALETAQKLAAFLGAQQQESGQFISKVSYESGDDSGFESQYYPGEAILTLARLHTVDGDRRWLERAELGARYLIEVRDAGKTVDELTHDHWLLMALDELDAKTGHPRYREHAERIAAAILKGVGSGPPRDWDGSFSAPPRSTPTAVRSEALVAMIRIAERSRQPSDRYREALERMLQFQLRCQLVPENTVLIERPAEAIGGFRKSLTSFEVRIDYVQHSMSSLLGYRSLLLPPR